MSHIVSSVIVDIYIRHEPDKLPEVLRRPTVRFDNTLHSRLRGDKVSRILSPRADEQRILLSLASDVQIR